MHIIQAYFSAHMETLKKRVVLNLLVPGLVSIFRVVVTKMEEFLSQIIDRVDI